MDDDDYVPPVVPHKSDILFGSDRARWQMDAMLDYRPGNDYTYRQGYRRAGRLLTQSVAERGDADFLVFPICHAYRHFVELTLKRLIREGCNAVHREMTAAEFSLQNNSHSLRALWTAFKVVQDEVSQISGGTLPPDEVEGIEAYIEQLHAVDKGSFSFRYPLTKDGEVSVGTPRASPPGRSITASWASM